MPSSPHDERDPESTQLLFQRYVNEARIEALLGLYEPEAAIIAKDGGVLIGLVAVRRHVEGLLALAPTLHSTVVRRIVVEDIAMLFSEWRITGTSPSGEPLTSSGRSFDVVRRQPDGTWRIAIDSPHGPVP
jgi:ketosteroid isomerase-like protein